MDGLALWTAAIRAVVHNRVVRSSISRADIVPIRQPPRRQPQSKRALMTSIAKGLLAGETGFEPATYGFGDRRSTN